MRISVHFPLDMTFKVDDAVEAFVGRPADDAGTDGCTRDMGWNDEDAELVERLRSTFPNIQVKVRDDG